MYKSLAIITFLLTISFSVSPFLTPEFSGFDPNQFPVPQDDPPVQPAGYAFSIWGIIYLWLIIGMGYGLWKRSDDPDWNAMRLPLSVSLGVGTLWLAVAVASPVWASILIWVMLISALVALFRAPAKDFWYAAAPVGLYAGWLSAASCVSLGLLSAGYGFLSQETAAFTFVFLALVLASAVQNQLGRIPTYGIAAIWALIAVVVANINTAPTIAALAGGGAVALALPVYKSWRSGKALE